MKKILTFGELLLRLAAPNYSRFFQENSFDATFCGSEANVSVSLANYGLETKFLSVFPNNDIGKGAINSLRYFGVDTSLIVLSDEGRMGLYYLEKGASQRSSKVIYDRKYSSFSIYNNYDWDNIFKDIGWFHISGINPALSPILDEICINACRIAKSKNITVSCDFNYRAKLWSCDEAYNSLNKIMKYVDVCIGNEEDASKVLKIEFKNTSVSDGKLSIDDYKDASKQICDKYGCKYVAFSLRESISASVNGWSGLLYDDKTKSIFSSKKYTINLVDRVGSGDIFAAGIIYGLFTKKKPQYIVDFAVSASCLKQTIEGDFNRVSIAEVENLMNSNGNGRVIR